MLRGFAICQRARLRDIRGVHQRGSLAKKRSADFFAWAVLALAALLPLCASAADLQTARKLLLTGEYSECLKACEEVAGIRDADWMLLHARVLLVTGQYEAARNVIERALMRYSENGRVRLLAYDIYRAQGALDVAAAALSTVRRRGMYLDTPEDAATLVARGKAELLRGTDPRTVLEQFFEKAKKLEPGSREPYVAMGELALDKHDYDLAAQTYREALKTFPDDADFHCGFARAWAPSDPAKTQQALAEALKRNPRHVPSLLLRADEAIDAGAADAAEEALKRALEVNPAEPEVWAYRAVMAHLRADTAGETHAHAEALRVWPQNPAIEHLIGRKLSQQYRFAEGSRFQRNALTHDPNFVPAKLQLALDSLRLGEEDEGWKLVTEVQQADAYNVLAHNLQILRDKLAKFSTLGDGKTLRVRMAPNEAAIYGERTAALLRRAHAALSAKYGVTFEKPVTVEIFPEQKDFAVRTFGMPGGEEFLGVCFGRVITAGSPARQLGHAQNWEAVLWHEFCHSVTLELTRNKMPRWLSEGISVYEEREADPSWEREMTPQYRKLILDGKTTPIASMDKAFSGKNDIQFAYFQSSLVVEFFIKEFGAPAIRNILVDLGKGALINDAIAKHTTPLSALEKRFVAFTRKKAEDYAPRADWSEPSSAELLQADAPSFLSNWLAKHPNNVWALTERAKQLLAARKWDDAKAVLKKLIDLHPRSTGADSAHALLAAAHRGSGDVAAEKDALSKLAALDASAADAFLRLMEIGSAQKDWVNVAKNAERFLAINPLVSIGHQHLAHASEELGKTDAAIRAYSALLLLNPADPTDTHFHLAKLLHKNGDAARAKRHVLQALEEAPRFREAHRLLLEISKKGATATTRAGLNEQRAQ